MKKPVTFPNTWCRPGNMELVIMFIFLILFIACGITIFHYLVSARKLFQSMESEYPDLYDSLDRPKVYIWIRSSLGTHYHEGGSISGQLKGIAWLLKGDFSQVSGETLDLATTVRSLFYKSLGLFFLLMVVFWPLFAI